MGHASTFYARALKLDHLPFFLLPVSMIPISFGEINQAQISKTASSLQWSPEDQAIYVWRGHAMGCRMLGSSQLLMLHSAHHANNFKLLHSLLANILLL